jgi:hypothetical protein
MRSPSLAPSEDAVHFVLCDFGKLGLAYVETEPVKTEGDVVADILSGDYSRPVSVMASTSPRDGHATCRKTSPALSSSGRGLSSARFPKVPSTLFRTNSKDIKPKLCG